MVVRGLKMLVPVFLLGLLSAFRAGADKGCKVNFHFENYVGAQRLLLDSANYTNAFGQPYTISMFKYYISDIKLYGTSPGKDKVVYGNDRSFLIRQDDELSQFFSLDDVPEAAYDSISFLIGVDSLHSNSGAQSGALDPINGMYWTWNTGYIFLKLEGHSPGSKSPGHIFEYHIGGFREPTNFLRRVSLTFPKKHFNTQTAKIQELYIGVDAGKVIDGPYPIDFGRYSSITDFHHAEKITGNYVHMFRIAKIGHD